MPNHHEASPKPESAPVAAESDESAHGNNGLLAMTQRLYERAETNGTLTAIEKLRHLHEIKDEEGFDEFIKELVYEALNSDEQFLQNMHEIKTVRSYSGPKQVAAEAELRAKQKAIFNEYKQEIVSLAGLPSEVGQDDYKIARDKAQAVITDHFANGGEKDNVLEALGIVTTDDEGKEVFTFPSGIMPPETNKKWKLYLSSVRKHSIIKWDVEAGTGIHVKTELEDAAKVRVIAHNALTSDVHAVLGLDKLVDGSWNFMKTRNLIAKMRDSRYPTVETAEKDKTAEGIVKASAALGVLGTRLSGLR